MSITLYQMTVPAYLQTLGAVEAFLAKGFAHCEQAGIDPQRIVDFSLYADMLPFRFQVQSVVHHSLGALDALESGVFRPPARDTSPDYPALQRLVAEARATIEQRDADAINARSGADLVFELGEKRLPFTTEGFVQSFSMPNFMFHASTAYGILRHNGVPLGKRDYLGRMQLRT